MDFTKLQSNLEKSGYTVSVFETAEEAAAYLECEIHGKTVAFGGSVTVRDMNLYERLSRNNTVFWHWMPQEGQTGKQVCALARSTDIYISSVNGIAETGEIVNIDGNGNRVAETTYGHEKVYLIAGKNKVAPDLHSAINRARNIASPLNAKRLNMKTPCAVKGDKCYDCKSTDRICRVLSVFLQKPNGSEYEVVLIDENIGY
ncbi:MAG: lactate utilization protein [Acutalibacteraceae bacterium]